MELYFSENFINLNFEKSIIYDINDISLKPKDENYLNLSFLNYYCEKNLNNKIIKFNGLYKDEYLLIFIDIFDSEFKTSVYYKDVIIIKLEWNMKKFNDDLYLWEIKKYSNKNYKYFILPIRKNIENNNDTNIDDLLIISRCIQLNLKMNNNKLLSKNKILAFLF